MKSLFALISKRVGNFLVFIFLCAYPRITLAQIINTIAGSVAGVQGYSGDGGPATAALLSTTIQIALDGHGNIFFSDNYNDIIRKIDACGIITTVAGTPLAGGTGGDGSAATAALLGSPGGVAVDGIGNMYISNDAYRIRKVSALGIITTIAGNGVAGFSGDGGPATAALVGRLGYITVDRIGNVYFCDQGTPPTFSGQRIRKIDTAGIITTYAGTGSHGFGGDGGPATAAILNDPTDISFDAYGNGYITDGLNYRIRKVDTAGIIITVAGTGTSGFYGDGMAATVAQLRPSEASVDDSGNILISDAGNGRLRRVNTAGIITTIAGNGTYVYSGDGGPATAAGFTDPIRDAVTDKFGNIFVSDETGGRIRMIGAFHAPLFVGDTTGGLHLNACGTNVMDINALLAVIDSDYGQTETWGMLTPPAHGAVTGTYSATTLGVLLTPTGFYYTAAVGYTGTDSFRMQVTDCRGQSGTATIFVTVNPLPNAGSIAGTDHVCPGSSVTLTDTTAGGAWSSSNTAISTVGTAGVAIGGASGLDTVLYTVIAATTGCSASALFPLTVLPHSACNEGTGNVAMRQYGDVTVWPNPNDGSFTLSLPDIANEEARVTIINVAGEKVMEFTVQTITLTPVKMTLPIGVYTIYAIAPGKTWKSEVVVDH